MLYTSLGRDFSELQPELLQTPIALLAGIRLLDSANANSIIGIARASPQWGRSVRYNDVRVVFDAGPLRYARFALVMRVREASTARRLTLASAALLACASMRSSGPCSNLCQPVMPRRGQSCLSPLCTTFGS